jgi:hypothetical protein
MRSGVQYYYKVSIVVIATYTQTLTELDRQVLRDCGKVQYFLRAFASNWSKKRGEICVRVC